MKARVLWFDDFFRKGETDKEKFQHDIMLGYVQSLEKETGTEVCGVGYKNEFDEHVKNLRNYDIVILDLHGLHDDNPNDSFTAKQAMEEIKGSKYNILTYIVSQAPDDDTFAYEMQRFEGRCFLKGQKGISDLISRMKSDLEQNMPSYARHPECRNPYKSHWLKPDNRDKMDYILK